MTAALAPVAEPSALFEEQLAQVAEPLAVVQVEKSAESHVEPFPAVLGPHGNVGIDNNRARVCPAPT